MKKDKLYFKSIDDTICYPIMGFIEDAKYEGLSEITLVEAIPDNATKEFIWCTGFMECVEKSDCKKSECDSYRSKSGRGKCKHKCNLYSHGEKVIIKIK